MKKLFYSLFLFTVLLAFSCQKAKVGQIESYVGALPEIVNSPVGNPSSLEKIKLGKLLFFDKILSGNNSISCATCHNPAKGYSDGLALSDGYSLGVKTGRNSPTILNAAFNGMDQYGMYNPIDAPMFYDNRMNSLEEQCSGPMLSPVEMMGPNQVTSDYIISLEHKLNNIPEYRTLFFDVFSDSTISLVNVNKAIASFERTLITSNSRFDQFARGDSEALNAQEIRGFEAFNEAKCVTCHSGPMFSDYKLYVLGGKENPDLASPDSGDGTFAFRTTTLRNLSLTAPYMHNGMYATLEEVMDFYEGKASENPHVNDSELAKEFQDLNMSVFDQSRKKDIIAFLRSLDDDNFDKTLPLSVPSGLPIH